jgi:hypothetical protein
MIALRKICNYFLPIFILNGILFIPFSFSLTSVQVNISQFLFLPLTEKIAALFQLEILLKDFSSDSLSLYILLLLLFVLSIIFATTAVLYEIKKGVRIPIENNIRPIARYYLALILLIYGFSKVFKAQFYLPEPNLLFTPLGNLEKDILFWSTIGSSRSYSIFLGIIEIIPALLLLFRKTASIGSFMAVGVLIHVVAINFSYSISVKLFSLFLLILALFLAFRTLKKTWYLFQTGQFSTTDFFEPTHSFKMPFYPFLKLLVISLLFTEALTPAIKSSNFNDDKVPRPLYHGAYSVQENQWGIKRFFIHRDGYLIFQHNDDAFSDFTFVLTGKDKFLVTDYSLKQQQGYIHWEENKKVLNLHVNGIDLSGTQLNTKKMPLLNSTFAWTVDL